MSKASPARSAAFPPFLAHRFPARAGQVRRRDRRSRCATRAGFCIALRAERSRGSDRHDSQATGRTSGSRFEGYTRRRRVTEQKILRDVFEPRRRLVPHRRPDAPGRARLLLLRRSHRRHVPLEGRERRHRRRSRSAICRFPGITAGRGVRRRRFRAPKAAPAWPPSSPTDRSIPAPSARTSSRRCRITRVRCSCASATVSTRRQPSSSRTRALVREGYDPARIPDALYVNDRERQQFVRLDASMYDRIQSGHFQGTPSCTCIETARRSFRSPVLTSILLLAAPSWRKARRMTIAPSNPTAVAGQTSSSSPSPAPSSRRMCRPAASTRACGLSDGSARCAGRNQFGQLGDGSWANSALLVQPSGLASVKSVAAGDEFSCAAPDGRHRRSAGASAKKDSAATARSIRSRCRRCRCSGLTNARRAERRLQPRVRAPERRHDAVLGIERATDSSAIHPVGGSCRSGPRRRRRGRLAVATGAFHTLRAAAGPHACAAGATTTAASLATAR